MGIFLIILVCLFVFWPWISRWIRGYMQRRAEDYLRRMTGMPPRGGKRGRRADRGGDAGSGRSRGGRREASSAQKEKEPLIPREYAEDVEFTEIKSYSETTEIHSDGRGGVRFKRERQVSDVEFKEIKS